MACLLEYSVALYRPSADATCPMRLTEIGKIDTRCGDGAFPARPTISGYLTQACVRPAPAGMPLYNLLHLGVWASLILLVRLMRARALPKRAAGHLHCLRSGASALLREFALVCRFGQHSSPVYCLEHGFCANERVSGPHRKLSHGKAMVASCQTACPCHFHKDDYHRSPMYCPEHATTDSVLSRA